MSHRARTLTFAGLPLLWAALAFATWHFWLPGFLVPISLAFLAVPASLGYAAVLLLEPSSSFQSRNWSHFILHACAVAASLVAYATALYGLGSLFGLLPEKYKFGNSAVYLSRSTVWLWAELSAGAFATSGLLYFALPPRSLSHQLCRATIGIVSLTTILFVPLLLSSHVTLRA